MVDRRAAEAAEGALPGGGWRCSGRQLLEALPLHLKVTFTGGLAQIARLAAAF
jgi:hypothetical protein